MLAGATIPCTAVLSARRHMNDIEKKNIFTFHISFKTAGFE
jgi:hypothetical protein